MTTTELNYPEAKRIGYIQITGKSSYKDLVAKLIKGKNRKQRRIEEAKNRKFKRKQSEN